MGFHADVGGMLNGADLSRRFFDTQLGDQRRGIGDLAKRIARPQLAGIGFTPGRVEARSAGPSARSSCDFEFFDRQNLVETGDSVRIGILGRRALAVIALRRVRGERQNRISSEGVSRSAAPGSSSRSGSRNSGVCAKPEDQIVSFGLSFEKQHAAALPGEGLTQGGPARAKLVRRAFGRLDPQPSQQEMRYKPDQMPILPKKVGSYGDRRR